MAEAHGTIVVTVVHGRHDHLVRQRRLLRQVAPDHRHVVVAMGDPELPGLLDDDTGVDVVEVPGHPFGLPLAAARNAGVARALDRGADLVADEVGHRTLLGPQDLVEGSVVARLRELGRQPGLGEGLGDDDVEVLAALVVDPLPQRVVERLGDLVTVLGDGLGEDPRHPVDAVLEVAVPLVDVLVLVERPEAHLAPRHGDVSDLLHLHDPAGGHPGPRAGGVEVEVDGLSSHAGQSRTTCPCGTMASPSNP